MANQVRTKKCPRPYNQQTTIDKSGYIIYHRRKKGEDYVVKEGTVLDNRFAIPHNIDILNKYKAHINMEWCNRTSAVKYLFKYISKGVDKATVVIDKGPDPNTSSERDNTRKVLRNEIQEYADCRYLSACESMWRTFAFPIHKRNPSVQTLTIHLEGQQNITLKDKDDLGRVLDRLGIDKTMFTEWMQLNRISEFVRSLTYVQIPKYFVWDSDLKLWSERKRGRTIGWIVMIHPSSGDLYYLRIIVNKIKGPRNYEEIRTVGGQIYPDYKSACYAMGLLDSDAEWHEAMDKANTWATPFQLRHMFVTFLIYCEVGSPKDLWMHCWRYMSEEILYKMQSMFSHSNLHLDDEQIQQYTLLEIEKILRQNERTLHDFAGIPVPDPALINALGNTLWKQEMQYEIAEEKEKHDAQYIQTNGDQRRIYEAVFQSIDNGDGKLFFVYGAGGTGKTFLYKTIISKLRSMRKIVLPVASSGIAALLLPGGRTAHSRFKIPLNVTEESICHIKKGTMLAELIRKTDLIIWDEVPMAHRNTFQALDKTIRDIMSIDNPGAKEKTFGGITVFLGGDFRQIFPVITQGSRADTVLASISQSYLWEYCTKVVVTKNLRLQDSDKGFSDWVLKVGEGNAPTTETDQEDEDDGQMVFMDKQFFKTFEGSALQQIADATYGNIEASKTKKEYFTDRAILTPMNETVDEINAYMISKVEGLEREYLSSDSFAKTDSDSAPNETLYAVEYLNTLEFPGLPSHKICLKHGAPIMLMRNINQKEDLCNGTRLTITYLGDRVIEGEIITGTHVGNKVLISRIILSEEDTKHPFTLSR